MTPASQAYAYAVPEGATVRSSFRVPTKENPIALVDCSCCTKSTSCSPMNKTSAGVTCSYCRKVCGGGPHLPCVGCCVGEGT